MRDKKELLAQLEAETCTLEALSAEDYKIESPEDAKNLISALAKNTSLKSIELGMGIKGAEDRLGEILNNPNLESLALTYADISDVGAESIAKALATNTGLKTLDLNNNDIGEGGLRALCIVLANNHSLEQLDLSANLNIKKSASDFILIESYLDRNVILKYYLSSLNKALREGTRLLDDDPASIITNLQTHLPDLESLPKDSYPREAFDLLKTIKAYNDVSDYAPISFKHKPFQQYYMSFLHFVAFKAEATETSDDKIAITSMLLDNSAGEEKSQKQDAVVDTPIVSNPSSEVIKTSVSSSTTQASSNNDNKANEQSKNIPKLDEKTKAILTQLEKYIKRIEFYRDNGGYDYGFWFFSKSREFNRIANYKLAENLRDELIKGNSLESVFADVEQKRLKVIKEDGMDREKDYVERGINSAELNAIIAEAKGENDGCGCFF